MKKDQQRGKTPRTNGFLIITKGQEGEATSPPITAALNWTARLKK
jgi:hypothetical protein